MAGEEAEGAWVEPVLQVEVSYRAITDEGKLRHAAFKGLREDLGPQSPPLSAKASGSRVPRENILQLLPEAVVPSQEELKRYWRKIGKKSLAHLGRRPLKLVRHVASTTFYHMGRLPPVPEGVHALRIEKRERGDGVRLWVDSVDGLLGLVEIGAVELHPWNATVDDIEHPDLLVFDLDPGEGIAWEFVIETALQLRELLQAEGFQSWPKLTGGKGLHLMAPMDRQMTHDAARRYARRLAQRLAATKPKRYTLSAALAARPGRLFIDYLRNGRGTTAVAAYSPRARHGFPIAAPVTWEDVEAGVRSDAVRMAAPQSRRRRRDGG